MRSNSQKKDSAKGKSGKYQSAGTGSRNRLLLPLILISVLLTAALAVLFLLKPPAETAPQTAIYETTESTSQPEQETTQTSPTELTLPEQSEASQTPETTVPTEPPTETAAQEATQSETAPTEKEAEPTAPAQTQAAAHPGNTDASVGTPAPTAPPSPAKKEEDSGEEPKTEETVRLRCDQFSIFSGQFVEDGRDELVENVAAMLVTNVSDRFLDIATVQYDIDGQSATFVVTGLPAGRSAWVMEANRMTVTPDSVFTYLNETTSYRDDISASSDLVSITTDGNMLTAANRSDETLEGIYVYYRTVHSDGNFFGGITYLVNFGTLEPGESVETMGGHFSENSEIVRIGWSE